VVESVYSAVRTDSLYKAGFITMVENVYSAVRTDSLYKADYVSFLKVNKMLFFLIARDESATNHYTI
jgi:hypothetical protein